MPTRNAPRPLPRVRTPRWPVLLSLGVAVATAAGTGQPESSADLDALRRQLQEAAAELQRLRESLTDQERRLAADRAQLERQRRELERLQAQIPAPGSHAPIAAPMHAPRLASERGAGQPGAAVAQAGSPVQVSPPAPQAAQQPPPQPVQQQAQQPVPQTVGQAPEKTEQALPEVAQIFETPGVLTPPGKWVLKPVLEYTYSTSTRVSVIGFEIFPALLLGVLDIQTANRTSFVGALTARYGVTRRFELEAKVPYVWRDETLQGREFLQASFGTDTFSESGNGLGDIELAARYQFNQGGIDQPYYIGTLRVKTRTGKDQFEVERSPDLPRGSGRFLELPTGTGFYGIRPELTVLYPTDPVVFFGGVNYLWNLPRHNVTDRAGQDFGDIDPGDAFGFNFGMGLALNERASFSIGYEHTIYGKTTINGQTPPSELTTQIGILQLGYSYKLKQNTNLNLSLGIGATEDAPDVQINLRLPMLF